MPDCCTRPGAEHYDLAVVGAGSAGFSAAITAAEGGKRVALVGHGMIGGTCVNVGCVPSKTMIRAAEALYGARAARRFPGLTGSAEVSDWSALIAAKDALVSGLRQKKYADLLPAYTGIDYIVGGPAILVDGGVRVADRLIKAPRTIIATGGRPHVPPIPGIADAAPLDSTALLSLVALPSSLIVLGGGYIGVELAQMMARMGVKVTILCRSTLLPRVEPEAVAALATALRDEGIAIHCHAQFASCSRGAAGVTLSVTVENKALEFVADELLLATGRTANTEALGLDALAIETNARGAIIVGDDMQTSCRGIYAAGDVTDRDQFVYMAAYGAKLAARNAVLNGTERYDNSAMPWVIFSDPQVAGVGLGAAAAVAKGHATKISVIGLDSVPRALAARDTRGVIKLVADATTDRLLGGTIVAPEGADSIQTLAIAVRSGMTAKALGDTLFPYLTTVEGLKLAAQSFEKDVATLSCCAG